MRELSLFSGAGGGLLGSILLGWRPVGYVEIDDYCQRVIAQRVKDGYLPDAPIFGDINAFISKGYAASYQGLVDVITAGFPCQPFSVAGQQQGEDDERNMWPQTIDTVRIVQPRYVLLENVPGIRPYLPMVVRDLRRSGYYVHPPIDVAASDVGANHRRVRVWIVAHDDSSCHRPPEHEVCPRRNAIELRSQDVADSAGQRGQQLHLRPGQPFTATSNLAGYSQEVANTAQLSQGHGNDGDVVLLRDTEINRQARDSIQGRGWWAVEPDVGRVADGVASRVDRLRALGNGQVPRVVQAAWDLLRGQQTAQKG